MRSKLKKINFKKKMLIIVIIYVLLFIASFFCALMFQGKLIQRYQLYKSLNRCPEISINTQQLKSFEKNGYSVINNKYTAETEDPQIIIPIYGKEIVSLKIWFIEPVTDTLNVQVFYTIGNKQGFSEENSVTVTVRKGAEECEIYIQKNDISNLRIDIGNQIGQTFILDRIILNKDPQISLKNEIVTGTKWNLVWLWTQIYFLCAGFAVLHLFIPVRLIYNFIFHKRWLVAGLLLLFLTVNRLQGDSLAIYDQIIQPGSGSQYIEPIIGEARYIRSDEYAVDTPARLASGFGNEPYGKYNYIQRGTATLNAVNGIYLGYSTLAKAPYQFSYLVLGKEYAFSFCWYAPIILTFMVSFELCLIIGRQKRLLALAGACLIGLSTFYLWWGFPSFLLGAQGTLVCGYYIINKNKRIQKIFCALGLGLSFAHFILMMYPAWLVPIGYVALLIAIWIFHDNWEKIKQFKIFDYTLLVGAVLFAMSMVAYYMKINAEYITAITGTVYPGQRMETGSFVLPDVFNYFQSFMYGFKDIGNASENSSFLCFFPIPLIAAGYQWIKDKRKDWFLSGMLSISIIFIIYCTIGFPESVSKITLFSYCPPTRIIPVLGLVEIYLLIRCLGIRKKEQKSFPVGASLLIGVITASLGWFYSEQKFSGYLLTGWAILAAAVIILVSVSVLSFRSSRQIMILEMFLVGVSVIVAFSIRPVSIGLDAIYSKPAAAKIQEICSEDETAKWLVCSDDFRTSGFVVACGASTLNSVNTYPNMELWEKLDIEHQYERVYNRYAHISVELVDEKTSFKLLHEDAFRLNLSYDDLDRIGCDYLFATKYLDGNSDDVILKIIYEENGCIIYKVEHKKSA